MKVPHVENIEVQTIDRQKKKKKKKTSSNIHTMHI